MHDMWARRSGAVGGTVRSNLPTGHRPPGPSLSRPEKEGLFSRGGSVFDLCAPPTTENYSAANWFIVLF